MIECSHAGAQSPAQTKAQLEQAIAALASPNPAPELRGERKLVTVMFADISGFTALSETLDPEAVRDLMNACFEALVPVVEPYGGTVDKFISKRVKLSSCFKRTPDIHLYISNGCEAYQEYGKAGLISTTVLHFIMIERQLSSEIFSHMIFWIRIHK